MAKHLTRGQAARLKRIEYSNRRRARERGVDVEKVDFIAICEAQGWKCALTGALLDPSLKGPHPSSISLDHRVGLTLGGGHTAGNVQATTLAANHLKGNKVEAKLGAKAKRQGGITGQRARRDRAKAAGTYRPMSGPKLQSKSDIPSRGFDPAFKRSIPSKNRPARTERRDV